MEGSTHPTPVRTEHRYLSFCAPLQAIMYKSPPLSIQWRKKRDAKLFPSHSLLFHHDVDGGNEAKNFLQLTALNRKVKKIQKEGIKVIF